MKLSQIKAELQAEVVQMNDPHILEQDFKHVFASDLMSDALAMIHEGEHVLFLTGLTNVQSLRTAEMLDIPVIIYVRNKQPDESMMEMANELGISIFNTHLTMFEACGILYGMGLRA